MPRIEAAAPDALVLIGATSSVGSAAGSSPNERMAPLTFLRELACVDARLQPLNRPECRDFEPLPGDGWSHHPYSLDLAPWQADPRAENVRMADLDRLTTLLHRLHEAGRTRDDLPLYLTESGYQTAPPDPTWDVTLADQARWLPEGEQIARSKPALRSVAQFLVRDLPERPGPTARSAGATTSRACASRTAAPSPRTRRSRSALVARRAAAGEVRFWGLVRPGLRRARGAHRRARARRSLARRSPARGPTPTAPFELDGRGRPRADVPPRERRPRAAPRSTARADGSGGAALGAQRRGSARDR